MQAKSAITCSGAQEGSDAVNKEKQVTRVPKFKSEDEEAAWWASADGREFLKHQSTCGSLQKDCPRLMSPKPGRSLAARGLDTKRF
jgi:hypothetical protein